MKRKLAAVMAVSLLCAAIPLSAAAYANDEEADIIAGSDTSGSAEAEAEDEEEAEETAEAEADAESGDDSSDEPSDNDPDDAAETDEVQDNDEADDAAADSGSTDPLTDTEELSEEEDAADVEDDSGESAQQEETEIYPWRQVTASSGATMISYDGLSADAYDVQIRITHSGEVGTAEYRISTDGGDTWSSAQVMEDEVDIMSTGSDGVVSDTGLTITFPEGRYTIDDTYSFSTNHEWQVAEQKMGDGILYVAGVPEVNETVTFMVRIIESGEPGTLTYQYSYDGGDSWSKEILSPSDGQVDLGNGIVFMFYGDFMAGDLYGTEIIGEAGPDYTILIILVIAAVVFGLFAVGCLLMARHRAGRDQYELQS